MESVVLESGDGSGGGRSPDVLEISVSDPVKQGEGSVGSFITYKVTTVTNIRTFANTRFSVIRRYSDFVWVHERLCATYKGVIVPPLPDKSVVGRFTTEFVKSRQTQLEKFCNRVAAHAQLRGSTDFRRFLEATEDELAAAKEGSVAAARASKGAGGAGGAGGGGSGGGGGGGFMGWIASSLGLGAPSAELTKDSEDIAFEEISQYLAGLEPQLLNVQKHTAQLIRKRRDMSSALFEFGLAFTLLGQSEVDALGNTLARLGHTADTLSVLSKTHADSEAEHFEDPIRDYMRLVGAAKAALTAREETGAHLRACLADLEHKRVAVTKLRGQAGRERHLAEAEDAVGHAEAAVAAAKEQHEVVTDTVLMELERFKREKVADIKSVVLDYVQLQIDHNKKLEAAWNALIPELEKVAVASSAADVTTEVGDAVAGAAGGAGSGAAGGAGGAGAARAAGAAGGP